MKHLMLILLIIPTFLFGQEWEKTFGSGKANSVEQTIDGGYIAIGTGPYYSDIIYMIKTDSNGDTLWTKHHSINSSEKFCSGHQTADGGYIITGSTRPTDDYRTDVFLLKTDSNGDTLWSKEYGGAVDETGYAVQQTMDGGYIVTGGTSSFFSIDKVYLVKTDSNGETMWTKTYGDNYSNVGRSVWQTDDGGYFITGTTYVEYSAIGWVYMIRTDSLGNVLWTNTYDDVDEDLGYSGQQTADGGYIVTGVTEKIYNNAFDILLLKLTDNGIIDWVRTYGEENNSETSNCVQQTTDGGYIIAGTKYTTNSANQVFLIKTDSNGNTLWTRTYGGEKSDYGLYVQQTSDEGYIISGIYQDDSDIRKICLIKTDENGIITFTTEIPAENPNKKLIKIVDLSGREISSPVLNTPYIEIYDDGTTQKKMKIE